MTPTRPASAESLARTRKSLRLFAVLRNAGLTAYGCSMATPEARAIAAGLARVSPPSDETWGLVVEALRFAEELEKAEVA